MTKSDCDCLEQQEYCRDYPACQAKCQAKTVRIRILREYKLKRGSHWALAFEGEAIDLTQPGSPSDWQFADFGPRFRPDKFTECGFSGVIRAGGDVLSEDGTEIIGKCRVTYLDSGWL